MTTALPGDPSLIPVSLVAHHADPIAARSRAALHRGDYNLHVLNAPTQSLLGSRVDLHQGRISDPLVLPGAPVSLLVRRAALHRGELRELELYEVGPTICQRPG